MRSQGGFQDGNHAEKYVALWLRDWYATIFESEVERLFFAIQQKF